jgi:hypothetical protein
VGSGCDFEDYSLLIVIPYDKRSCYTVEMEELCCSALLVIFY